MRSADSKRVKSRHLIPPLPPMTSDKPQAAPTRRSSALLVEFLVFGALSTWICLAFRSFMAQSLWSSHPVVAHHARGVLLALNGLVALAWWACPRQLWDSRRTKRCRTERDSGVFVGCVLPALTLLSCVLAQMNQQRETFPALTFLYAWSSVSIGLSALMRLFLACSENRGIAIAIDVVGLPLLARVLAIETSGSQHLLPMVARLLCSLLLDNGQQWLPLSFTLGEALVLAQGMTFGLMDLMLSTLEKFGGAYSLQVAQFIANDWFFTSPERSAPTLALQVGVTCSFAIVAALAPLLYRFGSNSPNVVAPGLSVVHSIWFLAIVLAVLGGVLFPWSFVLLDNTNPLLWLLQFVVEANSRWQLLGFWFGLLAVFLPFCAWVIQRLALRTIVARKLFHLLVVLLFIPGFYLDFEMLSLSYGVALALFVVMEAVRAVALPPFGQQIATFMAGFLDHREAGRAILTHTYLLLGCALPLWLSHAPKANAVAANAGVIALGVGDAMGAVVGSTYGRHLLIGNKTWEGTLATFGSMAMVSWWLVDLHSGLETALFLGGLLLTSILETCTSQIDNLVLPLYYFAACNLVACYHHQ